MGGWVGGRETYLSRRVLPLSVEAQRPWWTDWTTSVGEKDLMTKKRACLGGWVGGLCWFVS